MLSNKLKLIAVELAVLFAAMLIFLLPYYKTQSFNKSLINRLNAAALENEAEAAAERVRLFRLREKAKVYTGARENASLMTRKRIYENDQALLTLVNPWTELSDGYMPELQTVEDGFRVDRRCAQALSRMLFDCRQQGHYPVICSAYRTREYQQELYDKKIKRLLAEGVSEAEAPEIAAKSVAPPGTSEHQLGLAVDIIDYFYTNLDKGQERTETQKWLMEHCSEYGFILRYPNGTTDITGIIYEPWHYRYVGKQTAREIAERGITLEEYLKMES